MDLSKNPSQNIYNDELKDDRCSYQTKKISMEENENLRNPVEQANILGDLCGRSIPTNEPNNKNILKSAKESTVLEEAELVPENLVGPRKEKSEVVDEVETIEKIAEMIAISNNDGEDGSPKIKKRLKVLMSRNQSVNVFNNSDDNAASSIYSPLVIHENLEQYKNKSMNDQSNKKRKADAESTKNNCNEILEEPNLKKSPFEEVEHKLEEMFAGIEDEQLTNPTDEKNTLKKCNVSFEQCLKNNCIGSSAKNDKESSMVSCKELDSSTSLKSIFSTKATEKLENTEDNKSPLISKSMKYIKNMPPQRRLSIGMRKELLKHSNEELFKKKGNDDIDKEVLKQDTQNLTVKQQQVRKNISSNKNNKQNKAGKYKKDINFVKSHTSNSKKIIPKCEPANKAKQQRQKTKESRTQRLQSSENEIEEKQLQPRDIESKIRSPFILVKNNGNISVINTVTPDDLNEKPSRPKKPYNYAYERKTVKGCYSSTLGNRYDADTADSSWKCVFCKLGPHKKRLGDLFGPYVISSDCDEYRSIKDSFERFQRNDGRLMNFSNPSHKFNNVTSNSHNQNIIGSNYEDFIANHTAGMSQVSVNCYEIWVHEDCAVWAPNIFVVGSRLAGLEEAAWKSTRYDCVYCLKHGALLCCLHRGCKTTSHVPCAREFKWLLDESKFWVYCNKHTLNNTIKKN